MNVSIIIPVYNVAPYIEDCLKSVMCQTYIGSIECLIVDDCGTDDSIVIAEQMIAEYNANLNEKTKGIKFRILHHEHNRGLSAARNTGTDAATGDYVFYLDSDDEITENSIALLMEKVKDHPDVEMVQGNGYKHPIQKDPVIFRKKIIRPLAVTNNEVRQCYFQYRQMGVGVWNKLYRRDFLIKNNLRCREGLFYEDILWTFNLLKFLERACFVPDITYHYKLRPQSIVTGTDKNNKVINLCIVYHDILTHLTPTHEQEEFIFYAKRIRKNYVKYAHDVPSIKDVFQLCWDEIGLYGNWMLRMRMTVCYILGKFKYGWTIWSSIIRLKHTVFKLRNK